MYNAKSEPNEFIADSSDEAVAKACDFFGTGEDALKIVHVAEGEVSGLGSRSVVVAVPKDREPRRPEPDRGERRGGGGGRQERGRRGGRRESGGGGRRESRASSREPGEDRLEGVEKTEPAAAAPVGESKGTAEGELDTVGEFVLGTLERMGLGSFTITSSEEGDFSVYKLTGPAASTLSEDGRAADALQLLANQAEMQDSDEPRRIVVDVEGAAERRDQFLSRLADRASERALESGRSIALDPMNGRDRRIVHVAVREMDKVATMSIGEGQYRQVVIVPEGAAEYEKAVQSSEQTDS